MKINATLPATSSGPVTLKANAQSNMEDPNKERKDLEQRIEFFTHLQRNAASRKERLEELMQRVIAKTWDAAKKAKMVRRLVRSNQEIEQSVAALDDLQAKLVALVSRIETKFVPGFSTIK